MADEKKPTGDYPIGYRKPPRQSQFKKGQSGNPSGRPKGTVNFATALDHALSAQVVVNEGGQRRTVSKLEATVTQLVNKATLGDPRATQQLLGVLHVLDGEADELGTPRLHLTEADQQIKTRLIDRIRQTIPHTKGDDDDDTHS
jgi:hypothetical protein